MRAWRWQLVFSVLCLAFGGVGAGCAGEVEATTKLIPPQPAPAALTASNTVAQTPAPASSSDDDGDGILDDRCPREPETKNDFEDDDGCPDEAPDFFLAQHEVRYRGAIELDLFNRVRPASDSVIQGIAAVLAQHPEAERVDVGVHLEAGADSDKKSQQRADAIAKALTEAGVEATRLKATGYGARCTGEKPRIVVKVVTQTGAATGIELCAK